MKRKLLTASLAITVTCAMLLTGCANGSKEEAAVTATETVETITTKGISLVGLTASAEY